MAFVHGKDTFISLDGDDLSAFTNTSELSRGGDSHDVTCYGKGTHVFKRGLKLVTGSMGGIYDSTSTGPRAVIVPLWDAGDPVTVIRRPEGTGAGKPQDSISVIITNYVETNPVADMVAWTCEFQPADELVSSTQGA